MILDPMAIALQGIGYTPEAVAVQGFARVELFVALPSVSGGGASAGVDAYRTIRKGLFGLDESDVVAQIHKQDDEVLAVIMMAVIRGDVL
jgi:hypothetical protein